MTESYYYNIDKSETRDEPDKILEEWCKEVKGQFNRSSHAMCEVGGVKVNIYEEDETWGSRVTATGGKSNFQHNLGPVKKIFADSYRDGTYQLHLKDDDGWGDAANGIVVSNSGVNVNSNVKSLGTGDMVDEDASYPWI